MSNPSMEAIYPMWVELAAMTLTAEYCRLHGIKDALEVRYVHYHALAVVLAEEPDE